MVVEEELVPYFTWLLTGGEGEIGALPRFIITIAVGFVLALVVGYLISLVRYGPLKAGDLTYRAVAGGFAELFQLSWRRITALAGLAVRESIRRRVSVALIVFVLILLFASWFLQTNHQEPAKLFLSFVLTATTYLILMIALLLSAFSLPGEFKSKTIYTIMTKPVRAGDVVLGRILGFTLVGTALLLIMSLLSYVFVTRSLDHEHTVELANLENVEDSDGNLLLRKGRSSLDDFHRHAVEVDEQGDGYALSYHGHEHRVRPRQRGGSQQLIMSGPLAMMRARVPEYGKLSFRDRKGVAVAKGISVGAEWTYREFIEGGTSAAAVWTFNGINERSLRKDEDGGQYLPLELIVRVFRTYKGDIERGIRGNIFLRKPNPENPEDELRSNSEIFTARDVSIDSFNFPRKLYDTDGNEIDLIKDLVTPDGQLEVWVQCLDRAQYYGFAQADCYIRRPDASPVLNFFKAFLGIWVQMVLVIAIGVTCSTLLNGPVAMMFTVSFIFLGFFRTFFVKVASGEQVGGGPVESLVRLVTQKNLTTGLDDGIAAQLMYAVDSVLRLFMQSVAFLLPDFRAFSTVSYVAYGFNIPADLVARDLTTGIAFVFGLFMVGYFCLRTREVAK